MLAYNVSIKDSQMLSIFSGADLELPYRFQPYLKLVVSYDEYKKFCNTLASLSLSVLTFNISMYKRAIQESNEKLLLRLFYMDMSKAIMNELSLSAYHRVDGTTFGVAFETGNEESISLENMESELLSQFSKEEIDKGLKSLGEDSRGRLNLKALSKHNLSLLYQALMLRCLSYRENPIKYNINK